MKKKREAMRQKMLMFKRQFAMKQTHGLGIIKDEIESLVRRNAAELMEDFQSVVQASKDELGAELYALVQVAYRQRERVCCCRRRCRPLCVTSHHALPCPVAMPCRRSWPRHYGSKCRVGQQAVALLCKPVQRSKQARLRSCTRMVKRDRVCRQAQDSAWRLCLGAGCALRFSGLTVEVSLLQASWVSQRQFFIATP